MTERPTLRQLIDQTLERFDGETPDDLHRKVMRLCEIVGTMEPRQIWFTLPTGVEISWSLLGSDPLSREGRIALEGHPMDAEIQCHVRLRPPIMPGLIEFTTAVQSILQLEIADSDLLRARGLSMAAVSVQVWRVLGAASRLRAGGR